MKRNIFTLAMLLAAATAFTQTSRRTASDTRPARENNKKTTSGETRRSIATDNKKESENSATRTTPYRSTTSKSNTRAGSNASNDRNSRKINNNNEENYRSTRDDRSKANSRATIQNENSRRGVSNRTAVRENNQQARRGYATSSNSRQDSKRVVHNPATYRKYSGHHKARHIYTTPPRNRDYRAKYYPYRHPVNINIVWNRTMHRHYIKMYPSVRRWHYPIGYRIATVSAYDAVFHIGEVRNIYGRVHEVYYEPGTDEYFLYFGAYYPYHDFSVVIPGRVARRFSRRPHIYFQNQYMVTTGLITAFENAPEVVVKRTDQLRVY